MTEFRVIVCGECFSSNLGDGLISNAMLEMLEEMPDVTSVDLLDLSGRSGFEASSGPVERALVPAMIRTLHRWLYARVSLYATSLTLIRNRLLASRGRRREKLVAILSACDHLIIGGGQLLRDNRLAFPSRLATIVEIAETLDLPVSYFGVGVGSQWSALGKRYFRSALTRANVRKIFCRDRQSTRRLERYLPMLAGRVETTFDPALGTLDGPESPGEGIGLCVMNATTMRWTASDHPFADENSAVDFWVALYKELADRGHSVRLFTNGAPEDQELAGQVETQIQKVNDDAGLDCLCERPTRPNELIALIQSFSRIVAFRLHANIVAYMSGVPNVALAWDDKVEQFMDYTGQGDRFVSVDGNMRDAVERVCQGLESEGESRPREAMSNTVRQDLKSLFDASPATAEKSAPPARGRLAFFVTEDWYFCSHRLPLGVAAREAGYEVFVITREASHGDLIRSAGLHLIPVNLVRRSMNPFTEIRFIAHLLSVYRQIKPDIVHHVAMKPVIYGTIAARLAGVPAIVNALAGLGYLFSSESRKVRMARPFVRQLLRRLLNAENSRLILQNPDDVEEFSRHAIGSKERVRLIPGSGVDTEEYGPCAEPDGRPTVLLASRLLWDKGLGEFVEAARSLLRGGSTARFVLAGEPDEENPNAVPADVLQGWQQEGVVEWIGRRDDMPAVFASSHIVCLPSYREGLPKVLIEAAACGRPIVTTDSPGCREIVVDGLNGLLVPVRDSAKLADAIGQLLESGELRARMGQAGRDRVLERFSMKTVLDQTLDVYESLPGPVDE